MAMMRCVLNLYGNHFDSGFRSYTYYDRAKPGSPFHNNYNVHMTKVTMYCCRYSINLIIIVFRCTVTVHVVTLTIVIVTSLYMWVVNYTPAYVANYLFKICHDAVYQAVRVSEISSLDSCISNKRSESVNSELNPTVQVKVNL